MFKGLKNVLSSANLLKAGSSNMLGSIGKQVIDIKKEKDMREQQRIPNVSPPSQQPPVQEAQPVQQPVEQIQQPLTNTPSAPQAPSLRDRLMSMRFGMGSGGGLNIRTGNISKNPAINALNRIKNRF